MISGAFDDRDRAGVAHGKALARHALEVGFAADGAVEHGVADDDVLQGLRFDPLGWRTTTRPPDRPLPT